MSNQLTIIVIVGNETEMIDNCLKSCLFANKIILVTTKSTNEETIAIAKKIVPDIIIAPALDDKIDFSYWRNTGARLVKKGWILYVDADERITPELQAEISSIISKTENEYTNYDIPRANHFLNHRVFRGNSYPDYVKRLFLKSSFKGWSGALHEQPHVEGKNGTIKSDFIHLTHRSLETMLTKSIGWTKLEAQMLYDSNHPPVVWWRIIRMMATKFFERFIFQSMWKDGIVGWISVLFETFDTFMIYSQLWELQQNN